MTNKKFCVIGLGYFGLNLAMRLTEAGAEVLAIDNQQEKIDGIADKVTHAVCMDTTDIRALQSFGLQDMDAVIVAIGEGFESSIMTTAHLQEIGVKRILNRITSTVHERLLKLMNIEELLVPEAEAASHLAHRLMIPGIIESFEITQDYSIFEIEAPKRTVGNTLLELNLRQEYSLNLVTIKRLKQKRGLLTKGEKEEYDVIGVPTPETRINSGDILILFGKEDKLKNFLEEK
ncbi:MAG: TrkA family potassium uptake protein [Bacteroidetes bacterium]|nr:TrkA family potassium uptake protein [Bacteroidota bacterium]